MITERFIATIEPPLAGADLSCFQRMASYLGFPTSGHRAMITWEQVNESFALRTRQSAIDSAWRTFISTYQLYNLACDWIGPVFYAFAKSVVTSEQMR